MKNIEENIEDIREHILYGKPITPAQEVLYQRWANAYRFARKYKIKENVIKKLQALDPEYTRTSILRDIKHAESLFCEIEKYDKEMLRAVVVEGALRDMKMLNKLIYSEKRYTELPTAELAMLLREKRAAEKVIIDAAQLDETNADMPDVKNFQQLIVNVAPDAFTEKLIMKLDNIKRGGVLDLTEIIKEEQYTHFTDGTT